VTEQESFAYSISHDLRSPLLTISNFASLLADDAVTIEPAEQRDIIGRIQRSAARLDRLLLTLLDYTRVSRHPTPLEPLSIEEIVHDLLLEHAATIRERSAQIALQPGLPHVVGSRTLLNQALGNLLSNALKYTPPDRAPAVRIGWERRERMVILVVADEGIGIAPQHHERIFRIFERLHNHATYPGAGIGLALVRRAAERMHGRVWVESDAGCGSRFHLELPGVE
jgi:signal transduction histidine kinase